MNSSFTIRADQEYIKLGQLLKAANLVDSGSDAKSYILEGEVSVNGETCFMRGKKVKRGDTVHFQDHALKIE